MRIAEVRAFPLSFDMQGAAVTLGTGAMVKRDVVVVRVRTQDGLVGYGEAHHAMAPTVVAELVNTGLGPLLVGRDAHRRFQCQYLRPLFDAPGQRDDCRKL